jgi:hypothetical protein
MNEKPRSVRPDDPSVTVGRVCPWCRGRLVLQPAFPLTALIPGEFRTRTNVDIPESLRTIPAWVCTTAHCRYREQAL